MPYVLDFNRPAIEDGMAAVARYLDLPSPSFAAVLDWVLALRERIGIPHTLKDIGVDEPYARRLAPMGGGGPLVADQPCPPSTPRTSRPSTFAPSTGCCKLSARLRRREQRPPAQEDEPHQNGGSGPVRRGLAIGNCQPLAGEIRPLEGGDCVVEPPPVGIGERRLPERAETPPRGRRPRCRRRDRPSCARSSGPRARGCPHSLDEVRAFRDLDGKGGARRVRFADPPEPRLDPPLLLPEAVHPAPQPLEAGEGPHQEEAAHRARAHVEPDVQSAAPSAPIGGAEDGPGEPPGEDRAPLVHPRLQETR